MKKPNNSLIHYQKTQLLEETTGDTGNTNNKKKRARKEESEPNNSLIHDQETKLSEETTENTRDNKKKRAREKESEPNNSLSHDQETQLTEERTDNIGPNKKKRAKKGTANPSNWRSNKAKALRRTGKEYEGIKRGKNGSKDETVNRNPRKMGERCVSKKCLISKEKRQCRVITDAQRLDLFNKFWSEMDWNQRKTFVAALVQQLKKQPKRDCVDSILYVTT